MKLNHLQWSGVVFLTLGTLLLPLSGYNLYSAHLSKVSSDRVAQTVLSSCKREMGQMGRLTISGSILSVTVDDVADPQAALADATYALAACPASTIETFCLGRGCSNELGAERKITMSLRVNPLSALQAGN
ncbi:hypothetical protein ACFOY8_13150 [Thalassospira xianhensis]|uniref:Uncharacterized protein n=2 Tax=Thalassospira TaxID=168934 RepID=A0A285TTR4_9PROT|nr:MULTISPECIES: hypothetical protein [Thalassospira]RCK07846.1 hypothetical protein TH5_02140 [Thalassospira xianhensis MCCC 1A02616]SOC27226.1 hypothetical protein SAMN05428964_105315 [Thalassospira xiamenensis]